MTHFFSGWLSSCVSLLCILRVSLLNWPFRLARWASTSADSTACNDQRSTTADLSDNMHAATMAIKKPKQIRQVYYPFWGEILDCLTWIRLQQPQEQHYPVLQVHSGSFCVSVIQQILTWTTGSLTCVCDHSYACIYRRRLGTPTSQHIFDSEKLSQIFLVLLTGFEPRVFGSRVRRSTN